MHATIAVGFPTAEMRRKARQEMAAVLRHLRAHARGLPAPDTPDGLSFGQMMWLWHAWRNRAFEHSIMYGETADNELVVFYESGEIVATNPVTGSVVWEQSPPPVTGQRLH